MRPLLYLLLFVALAAQARKRYDNFQLIEVKATNQNQHDVILDLGHDHEIDFWSDSARLNHPTQILLPPKKAENVKEKLTRAGMDVKVIRGNVQKHLDSEWERLDKKMNYEDFDYNNLEQIWDHMDSLAQDCHQDLRCDIYSIGDSYEGREIRVMHITKHEPGPGEDDRRAFWFDSTVHAREWLATQTTMNVLNTLVKNYGEEDDETDFLDNYDFYFLPVANPDGYVYTWEEDRYWRKSRNVNEGSECMGVDLNRNFEYFWGEGGTSNNPCSNNYLGPAPASEPETQVLQAEALRLGNEIISWVSTHTQGNMYLHPWGYLQDSVCVYAEDHDDMYEVATAMGEATEAVHNTAWTWGNLCETIYPASGVTCDYVKGVAGIKYSYTPELRGPGHDPPASELEPAFEETYAGFKAMIRKLEEMGETGPIRK